MNVRALRWQQGAFQEAFYFVFEAYFLVRNGPILCGSEGCSQQTARNLADASSDAVGAVGEVATEEFVGSFTAQGHGRSGLTQFREEPNGQRAGIGAWFIGVVSEFLNRALQVNFR